MTFGARSRYFRYASHRYRFAAALASGNEQRATELERGAQLFIFLKRDHGALLQVTGRPRNALQYEIGNPHTASKMTRHRLAAGLYAPLRVLLYEDETGGSILEYDRPSSLFGQYGDERDGGWALSPAILLGLLNVLIVYLRRDELASIARTLFGRR